jgi:hypothetical protein
MPNFREVISQLVEQFDGIYCPVIDHCLYSESDVILSHNLLGLEVHYRSLHIDFGDCLSPWVNYVESWLEDLFKPTEILEDTGLSRLELHDKILDVLGREDYRSSSICRGTRS